MKSTCGVSTTDTNRPGTFVVLSYPGKNFRNSARMSWLPIASVTLMPASESGLRTSAAIS